MENDMEQPEQEHFAVLYTESHPDKCTQFVGVFSSEEKAQKAIEDHMAREKRLLPRARISECNYQIFSGEIDGGYWFE